MKELTSKLYFSVFAEEDPVLEKKIAVFVEREQKFLGVPVSFKIIGWSHFISSQALEYNEVFSSIDVVSGSTFVFDMKREVREETARFETEKYFVSTELWVGDYLEDVNSDAYDLFHVFPNSAYTGISIKEHSYETVHAYPEFGKNVYTRTNFARK